jgi:type IV secretion system protein VirD4
MTSNQNDPGPDTSGWEKLILGAAIAAVIGGAAVLTGGAAASVVTGRGWAWPAPEQASRTVIRLLAHPGDPAAAYPAQLAGRIPGAATFWTVTAFILLAVVTATAVLALWVLRRRTPDGMVRGGQIRKATKAARAEQSRPFAAYRGRPVTARTEDSCVTVAPSRAGKTTSLAAPRVVDARGPVVATSTKTDLLRLTAGARAARGPVHVWDADDLTGWDDLARWDIVAGCADVREAAGRARAMVAARPLSHARNTGFFAATAETVLRCLLHAAALRGASMREVMGWARDFAIDEPYAVLRDHPLAAHGWFDDLRKYCRAGAPETISSTDMSLGLVLNCLADPRVLDQVCPIAGHGIDVEELVAPQDAKPATLYVLCEGGTGSSTAPLATALVSAVVRAGRRASQTRGDGRLEPACTFVLDEAPNVAPIPELPMLIADGGGRGMPAWVFAQSFGQLRARWGRDDADTMWGSAPIKLVLGGAAETDDLERLSRLLGERRVRRVSSSRGQGTSWSRQTSTERERVMPVEAIRQLDVGQALLLYRSLPPAVVDLPAWWQRRDAASFRASLEWAQSRAEHTS